MNKTLLIILVVAIAAGGAAFYGGMKYAESKNPRSRLSQADFQNLQNLSPEERQQRLQEMGVNAGNFRGGRAAGQTGGGFASGEIISKDDTSVTIKLRDARLPDGQGGSKIIFLSNSTEIGKFATGTASDLEVGSAITVNGKTNSDGSITADSIQIRPLAQPAAQ
ncbi:hypothetical protein A3I35_04005 [Candidatus Falkowbacteria bacterium RIFCSPLOWO2_02_FULL_45_15]|uniref:DUF5666 domain-containing protein n=2 Tax=Candidatus Falkowiibacteriota TaxID=1752728 RepID=A0A1F5RW91_9BACT|nr:MAG: hypothetical protein A3I35_04005 [Candidatus Falkowbacteria bacterium RIFCSPLOWO2_02_FULL_45_15]